MAMRVEVLRNPMLSRDVRVLLSLTVPQRRLKDVATATGLSFTTVSRIIRRYISAGIVIVTDDGYYMITEKGREYVKKVLDEICRVRAMLGGQ